MTGREIINAIFANADDLNSEFIINVVHRNSLGCAEYYQSVEYSVNPDARILIEKEKCLECETHLVLIAALKLRMEEERKMHLVLEKKIEEKECVKCKSKQCVIEALEEERHTHLVLIAALEKKVEEERNTVDLRGTLKEKLPKFDLRDILPPKSTMTGREIIEAILKNIRNLDSEFTVKNIQRNRQGDVVNIYNIEGYTVVDGEIIIETRRQ